ncbi:hypothetical protein CAEBREN_12086 [Caenorhabditis brenneri]|uniref:Uncharacterized protein n=1 Tax=Caenorhabditis brenneri TaxID=135651 RepID=G0N1A9_CAEBE|nr:hypothetical protein CAEBREN_12086 [Caenorhabditis brenneri]
MDRIRERVNTAYNETFGYLLMGLMAFFFVVWGAAACVGYVIPTGSKEFKVFFAFMCLLGWIGSGIGSIFALEYWLRTPQVRRPYDEDRDRYGAGIPLHEREHRVAAPPAAQN